MPLVRGALFLLLAASPLAANDSWTAWGGPNGDFTLDDVSGLAEKWPEGGPPILWSRELGSGYSSIIAEEGVLYTQYRGVNMSDERDVSDQEHVVALDARTGTTLWDFAYDAPNEARAKGPWGGGAREFIRQVGGQLLYLGPNATPLVYDGLVYAIGGTAKMHALDKKSGRVVWERDFFTEFGALSDMRGRSPSPIEYDGKIIMVIGGDAGRVMAFDPKVGDILWKSPPGDVSHATPIVANVHGEDQLVFLTEMFIVGLAAKTGEARWDFPHPSRERVNIPNVLFLDGEYFLAGGINQNETQLIRISKQGDAFTATRVWAETNKIKTYQTPGLRFGDHVYMGAEQLFYCFNWKTDEMVWRTRDFPNANLLHADGSTLLLDGEGKLNLVRLTPKGVDVVSSTQLFEARSWTSPTLVGTKLYVRNKREIKALELGAK